MVRLTSKAGFMSWILRVRMTSRISNCTGLRYARSRLDESFHGAWKLSQRETAGGWETVGEFIGRAAARSRQDAFPVVGPGGDLAGVCVPKISSMALASRVALPAVRP